MGEYLQQYSSCTDGGTPDVKHGTFSGTQFSGTLKVKLPLEVHWLYQVVLLYTLPEKINSRWIIREQWFHKPGFKLTFSEPARHPFSSSGLAIGESRWDRVPPDGETFAKNQGKEEKLERKRQKSGRFFYFAPPDR